MEENSWVKSRSFWALWLDTQTYEYIRSIIFFKGVLLQESNDPTHQAAHLWETIQVHNLWWNAQHSLGT